MDILATLTSSPLTGLGVIVAVAICVITDRLVWHTRLEKAEAREEQWRKIALESLTVGARAGGAAAETVAAVISALPDPVRDQQQGD